MENIKVILKRIYSTTYKVTAIHGFHLCLLTAEGDIELKIKILQCLPNDL